MFRQALIGIALMLGLAGAGAAWAQTDHPAYAAGQVWTYHTRPGDDGSLLKIQQVEDDPALTKLGPIYHISIIRVHLGPTRGLNEIGHSPVSKETLDKSVVALVKTEAAFPDASGGIEQWRAAKGGVFTISVAEIVDLIDKAVTQQPDPAA